EVARGHQAALADKRFEAASVLSAYAADQPETLVEVLAESDERQFALLLPKVQAQGEAALAVLHRQRQYHPPWHHRLPDEEHDALAVRQANVALALLRLGRQDSVWPLLRHTPDPTRRTYLSLRMASRGVEARLLVERLEAVPAADERRALI